MFPLHLVLLLSLSLSLPLTSAHVKEAVPIVINPQSMDHPDGIVNQNDYANPVSVDQMVMHLKKERHIFTPTVARIMSTLKRYHYVSARSRGTGTMYHDVAIHLPYEATISAPSMHADCLEQLAALCPKGSHMLDIGTGSGYMTAAMALLTGEQGQVTGIDVKQELVDLARESIMEDSPQLLNSIITLAIADGHKGYPSHAPYDCIFSGASFDEIPEALIEQLKVGGAMLMPLLRTGTLTWTVVKKNAQGELDYQPHENMHLGIGDWISGIETAVTRDTIQMQAQAQAQEQQGQQQTAYQTGPTYTPPAAI